MKMKYLIKSTCFIVGAVITFVSQIRPPGRRNLIHIFAKTSCDDFTDLRNIVGIHMDVVVFSCKDSLYTVGRAKDCDYVLYSPFISRRHFTLRAENNGYVCRLDVSGKNGVWVNGEKVECGRTEYITEGDFITLGDTAFVYARNAGNNGKPSDETAGNVKFATCTGESGTESLNTDPIEIEPPPARRPPEKPSILLAAGPAITMALPIALGLGRTISYLSAIVAAVWAVVNVLSRQKRCKKEEQRRKSLYFRYIDDKKNEILERNRKEKLYLKGNYPDIGKYFYEEDCSFGWRKKAFQNAGLIQIRLGRGKSKPMYELIIPKERLSVVDDSLRLLPLRLYKENYILEDVPLVGEVQFGSKVAIVTGKYSGKEEVSALLLNIAAGFTPDELCIYIKGQSERIMKDYSFLAFLPHYGKKGKIDNVTRVIICEDDKLLADEGDIVQIGRVEKFDCIGKKAAYALSRKMCIDWEKHLKTGVIIPEVITLRSLSPPDVPYQSGEGGNRKYCSTADNICFPIGIGEDGKTLYLDLSEEADGPHGLIAGTTGSGKSELITTVILSAAIKFPPDELCFFLIDYKGGAMAGSFGMLPHVIGQLTNLSSGQIRRVRIALKSENLRRQELFERFGVNSITEYNAAFNEGRIPDKLPHLVIVVDEFAELKREQPEFMENLISISQIGRSLGIHLILSTQKPSGVVDDKIRSNTKFKIALRMEDKTDSNDVIGCADAAFLTGCKNGIIKRGGVGIPQKFQSAYCRSRKKTGNLREIVLYEDPFLMHIAKEYENGEDNTSRTSNEYEENCLEYYLRKINDVCNELNLSKPERLWLGPVPEEIRCDGEYFALADDVDNHCYTKIKYNPTEQGSLLLIGDYGAGIRECLESIAFCLCCRLEKSPEKVISFYICDFAEGKLTVFGKSPYCGGVVSIDNDGNAQLMLRFIYDEMLRRRREGGSGYIVFIISNYGEFIRNCFEDGGRMIEEILKYGKSVGIFIIASAVDISMQEMPSRTAMGFDSNMIFGNMDVYRAAQYLKVSPTQIFEIENVIGRGLMCVGGRVLEFQSAIIMDESALNFSEFIDKAIYFKALPYPYIPKKQSLDKLLQRAVKEYPPSPGGYPEKEIPAGYIKENGRIFMLPIGKVKCILIYSSSSAKRKKLIENISIILGRYHVYHYCINSDQASKSLMLYIHEQSKKSTENFKSKKNKRIVLFNDLTDELSKLYKKGVSAQEEEKICSLLDNSTADSENVTIIAAVSDDIRINLAGKKVLDALLRKPYGITCKEDVLNQRLFDYSYVTYSSLKDVKEREAVFVSSCDETLFSGEAICPQDIIEKCG